MTFPAHPTESIEVGIFGGSGFYTFLETTHEVTLQTPYGAPSAPVVIGEIEGRSVGFLPRHGPGHTIPPHRINYRANVWAMKHLGASDVILPCAAGSLRADLPPGTFVLADQIVDRTQARADTFFDGPSVTHVSFAHPYDEEMRAVAAAQAAMLDIPFRDAGTLVVIQGPRFSTKAESQWFAAAGWDVVGMTGYPEAVLCREAEMAALNISLVTDYDAGLDPGLEGPGLEHVAPVGEVSTQAVIETFNANVANLRRLLFQIVPALPLSADRPALSALDGAALG